MNVIAIPLQEERELELRDRLSLPSAPWRVSRMWTRIAFFVLACIATSWFFGLLHLMELPKGWITAIATVGFAEYLIQRKKFLRTGIEAGFYIAGLCAFIFGLPGEGKPEAILLFVLAFLIAGVRLAHGFFTAVSALLIVLYAGVKSKEAAVAAGVALAIFAVAALWSSRELARPFLSLALSILTVVLLPLATLLWWIESWGQISPAMLALGLAFSIFLGWIALVRRDRALLLAAILTFVVVLVYASEEIGWIWETKLLVAGIAALIVALAVNRFFRNRTTGITSDRLTDVPHVDVIEMAGAAVITPATAAPQEPGVKTGGGSFGGAGATGEF